jgi:hypothetical protein
VGICGGASCGAVSGAAMSWLQSSVAHLNFGVKTLIHVDVFMRKRGFVACLRFGTGRSCRMGSFDESCGGHFCSYRRDALYAGTERRERYQVIKALQISERADMSQRLGF